MASKARRDVLVPEELAQEQDLPRAVRDRGRRVARGALLLQRDEVGEVRRRGRPEVGAVRVDVAAAAQRRLGARGRQPPVVVGVVREADAVREQKLEVRPLAVVARERFPFSRRAGDGDLVAEDVVARGRRRPRRREQVRAGQEQRVVARRREARRDGREEDRARDNVLRAPRVQFAAQILFSCSDEERHPIHKLSMILQVKTPNHNVTKTSQ